MTFLQQFGARVKQLLDTKANKGTTLEEYGITDAINVSEKGAANGIASLDSGGKVPANQLPSFVDEVLDYSELSSFPADGETGKIYVAIDTNKTYRWSGSTYIEISPTAGNADSATKFATARKINGVDFDGTKDIVIQNGFKNHIINGGFDIWQRGTIFTAGNGFMYSADRWQYATTATNTFTISNPSANTLRFARNNSNINANAMSIYNMLETKNSLKLAGKTVTLSFNLLCGSGFSPDGIYAYVKSGKGVDQGNLGWSGWTGESNVGTVGISNSDKPLTKKRYSVTCTTPSDATQIAVMFTTSITKGTANNDYFEISEVQLEEGSVATPFEQRPYGLELSLCQRYYEIFEVGYLGTTTASNLFGGLANFKVQKRATPTITFIGSSTSNLFDTGAPITNHINSVGGTFYKPATASGGGGVFSSQLSASAEL